MGWDSIFLDVFRVSEKTRMEIVEVENKKDGTDTEYYNKVTEHVTDIH